MKIMTYQSFEATDLTPKRPMKPHLPLQDFPFPVLGPFPPESFLPKGDTSPLPT